MSWAIRRKLQAVDQFRSFRRLPREIQQLRLSLGRVESRLNTIEQGASVTHDLYRAEFSVFSQNGEDGVLDFLIERIPQIERSFLEIGTDDYSECNTRFLARHRHWSGVFVDGNRKRVEIFEREARRWELDVTPVAKFVRPDNIESLIAESGLGTSFGLLSLDIDGNDYWVLDAMKEARPAIIVVEYNSLFGPTADVSVPFHADFQRTKAHHSNLIFGVSLEAATRLLRGRGYALVHCESAGVNAFYVRSELLPSGISERSAAEAYVPTRVRQALDEAGNLSFAPVADQLNVVSAQKVFDFRTQSLREFVEVVDTSEILASIAGDHTSAGG